MSLVSLFSTSLGIFASSSALNSLNESIRFRAFFSSLGVELAFEKSAVFLALLLEDVFVVAETAAAAAIIEFFLSRLT